jgi:phospholipid-binding lipoprotein MlaA
LIVGLLSVFGIAGCATPPPASDKDAMAEFRETNDPLEPTNRVFYAINNGIDTVLLRPLAVAYKYVLPETVRSHTHNFLNNLGNPVQLADDMFQAKPRRAGDTLMRLLINTTVGVGGIFDVATDWGWPDHDSDGGMTLALWGLPDGPFLFLPVLGPSSPRDAGGFAIDYAVSPLSWIGHGPTDDALGYARTGLSALDARAAVLDDLDKIKAQALDPYATLRSLYRQHRQSQINDARADNRATVPAWFPAPQAATAGASKP